MGTYILINRVGVPILLESASLIYLCLVILTLLVTPFVFPLIQRLGEKFKLVESGLFFSIAGLVMVQILPDAYAHAGYFSLIVFVLTWTLPWLLEFVLHSHHHDDNVHVIPIVISVFGLAFHGITDGISLSYGPDHMNAHFTDWGLYYHPLPMAVVLHSLPASLFLYWVTKPKYGWILASSALALIGLTTISGFVFGTSVLSNLLQGQIMGVFEGMAAGSLMHLASHRINH